MEIEGFKFPDDLLYDPERHIWVRREGDHLTIGITDLGQYMAGRLFGLEVNTEGKFTRRTPVFSVESAKWIGKYRLPFDGEVREVNREVVSDPGRINQDAYGSWIVKVVPENMDEALSKFKDINASAERFRQEALRVKR